MKLMMLTALALFLWGFSLWKKENPSDNQVGGGLMLMYVGGGLFLTGALAGG